MSKTKSALRRPFAARSAGAFAACTLVLAPGCIVPVQPDEVGCNAPDSIFALTGRGDVVVAGTNRGVVIWNSTSGDSDVFTTAHGLLSDVVHDVDFDVFQDRIGVATARGLGSGGLSGPWEPAPFAAAKHHRVCAGLPGGGWIAGGAGGRLVAWTHDRVDSLRLPEPATITGFAFARPIEPEDPRRHLACAAGPPARGPCTSSTPLVPAGLVVATDGDGIWLLQSTGIRTRWLQFESRDGLPSRRVRGVVADPAGHIWAATERGLARIEGLELEAWPEVPLLARPMRDIQIGGDGSVYVALQDGLLRLHADAPDRCIERLAVTSSGAVRLACIGNDVWWSDGVQVASLQGARLRLPEPPAACPVPRTRGRRTAILERLGTGSRR